MRYREKIVYPRYHHSTKLFYKYVEQLKIGGEKDNWKCISTSQKGFRGNKIRERIKEKRKIRTKRNST